MCIICKREHVCICLSISPSFVFPFQVSVWSSICVRYDNITLKYLIWYRNVLLDHKPLCTLSSLGEFICKSYKGFIHLLGYQLLCHAYILLPVSSLCRQFTWMTIHLLVQRCVQGVYHIICCISSVIMCLWIYNRVIFTLVVLVYFVWQNWSEL